MYVTLWVRNFCFFFLQIFLFSKGFFHNFLSGDICETWVADSQHNVLRAPFWSVELGGVGADVDGLKVDDFGQAWPLLFSGLFFLWQTKLKLCFPTYVGSYLPLFWIHSQFWLAGLEKKEHVYSTATLNVAVMNP